MKDLLRGDLVRDSESGNVYSFITMFRDLYLVTNAGINEHPEHYYFFALNKVECIEPKSGDMVYTIDNYGQKSHWASEFIGKHGELYVLYVGENGGSDPYFTSEKVVVANIKFHGETPTEK